jgi:hypothetical protein
MDQTNHNLLLRVSSVNSKNNGNLYINISYIIILNLSYYMGVSINGGSPKWMVYFSENPIKIDDLGVPPFQETSNMQL